MTASFLQTPEAVSVLDEREAALERVRETRQGTELALLEQRRALRQAEEVGVSQTTLAAAVGVSQPAVAKALKFARKVRDIPAGFSGADPYEIAQRYAAGEIGRAQVIDELRRWTYAPLPEVGPLDDYAPDAPGSSEDLSAAYHRGLIDRSIMEEVLSFISSKD